MAGNYNNKNRYWNRVCGINYTNLYMGKEIIRYRQERTKERKGQMLGAGGGRGIYGIEDGD